MGLTMREKHIRPNRRQRSSKPDNDHSGKSGVNESGTKLFNHQVGVNQNPNSHSNDSGWGYCTEEQLEEILLKNMELLYSEAVSKLMSLGYDEDVVVKAVLRNGNYYNGGMDVLTNVLHNSLTYLNNGGSSNNGNSDEGKPVFANLKQLEEFSVMGMVYLLQQLKPRLSKGDAMWCILMSNLHLGRASMMGTPVLHPPASDNQCATTLPPPSNVGGNHPALCRFHGGWGFGSGGTAEYPVNKFLTSDITLQREIDCPKRFNLTPSMKSLLKRNVAAFAAEFRANSKESGSGGALSDGKFSSGVMGTKVTVEHNDNLQDAENVDVVSSMLDKFRDLNLDENEYVAEDEKDEIILGLIHQVRDLETQVKERKEWAHQKAMQAARKLSHDLAELKILRMEREETQRLKIGKQTLEDSTMMKLSEMENALRKASGQVDRANTAIRRLETENAEIRAEMEASKLSASESVTTCLEAAKREKKGLKRLLAWEKQKTKLQDDIAKEKQNIAEFEAQLLRVEASHKEAEAKWMQAQKAKESALAQVEEERRLKEATEASNKRAHEALRLKIEIDFQRHKDDLRRLEQELSRLKVSAQTTEMNAQLKNLPVVNIEGMKHQEETIARMLIELDNHESLGNGNRDRECIICMKDEVSVVFLPCAHQVLCSDCSDNYGKKGKALCPCCRAPIEQRIRVFGAGSS